MSRSLPGRAKPPVPRRAARVQSASEVTTPRLPKRRTLCPKRSRCPRGEPVNVGHSVKTELRRSRSSIVMPRGHLGWGERAREPAREGISSRRSSSAGPDRVSRATRIFSLHHVSTEVEPLPALANVFSKAASPRAHSTKTTVEANTEQKRGGGNKI